jgi:hypothetical protein
MLRICFWILNTFTTNNLEKIMPEQEQAIIQTVPTQSLPVLEQPNLGLLLKYGDGAAAIILSISILLLAVAEIIKVLVPVMLHKTQQDIDEDSNSS